MVTAGTLYKARLFDSSAKLDMLERSLLSLAKQCGWQLEAWAVLANHYHFVARGTPHSAPMLELLRELHSASAREVNRLDGLEGRTVWHNYWDTRLTYQYSYLSRLSYVHRNAAKHGLVTLANQYPWCSAAWFERTASPAQVETIYGFKTDRVKVQDDF
jgi:putative transposase